MAVTADVEVLLEEPVVDSGELLLGRIPGGAREVQVLRRERTPTGSFTFHVAGLDLAGADTFAVELPAGAVPTWECDPCAVSYLAVARRGPRGRREHVGTAEFAVRARIPPASAPLHLYDRLIANFDGRHFRVELAQGTLAGGGAVSGRAHLQPGHELHPQAAVARCMESWRLDRSIKPNRPPTWHIGVLWEEAVPIDWSQPGTWAPFGFQLPEGLPPAFEGRMMAWRYEVELRRRRRFGLTQRAVLTPTGFGPD
jgi:hypothetical protein